MELATFGYEIGRATRFNRAWFYMQAHGPRFFVESQAHIDYGSSTVIPCPGNPLADMLVAQSNN